MARKQNPINDIINTVGGWLGGRGPGTNPQVQAAMNATRAVGKVVDTATGGFGSALLSDAQRMAQTGSSTPSALYKTAAVNLGAAAAGAAAAKVVQKTVARVAPQLTQDVGVHFSRNKNIEGKIIPSPSLRGTGKGPSTKANFEINVPVAENKTYKFAGFGPTLGNATKRGEMLPASKFKDFMSAQDTAYVTRSRLGRVDTENPALYKGPKVDEWFKYGGRFQSQRMTGAQRIVEKVTTEYDDVLTRAVDRARKQLEADRLAAQRASAVAGAAVGAAINAKRNRGGGTKKK
jgi:hypothetical protein